MLGESMQDMNRHGDRLIVTLRAWLAAFTPAKSLEDEKWERDELLTPVTV